MRREANVAPPKFGSLNNGPTKTQTRGATVLSSEAESAEEYHVQSLAVVAAVVNVVVALPLYCCSSDGCRREAAFAMSASSKDNTL